ncbi:MAG: bifunctional phosphopantothenoylcysteine decarboxylase/phosphopantothenate--cysteine ligase CoaBC [Synergistaceae bacterium]|jgi:phosphopantothenoylcysteine decarboxylase/phosphopantothenate--cysteine ligase|nr:bifunctional phosphopantothenoylcysteine decarboxylase/phosphopantothenate--cysteine ligase CoaBC [Synergistaceae bacterium]
MPPGWARSKKILLGVSGGIAAYKTPDLVRAWIKVGCEVEVILTDMGARLVSPLALSVLSKRRAWRDCDLSSDERGWRIPHISLSGWADVIVIAPCTANVLRMAACGDSSTLLGAAMLAHDSPIVFFPAMNSRMWTNPATRENARVLRERGHRVVDPDSGPLACGYEGTGRLPSADAILDETWCALRKDKDFAGRKVLVTAGPTHEYIDPVRFISNPSSGKMGCAIAAEARYRGAEVVLVSGPTSERPPSGVRVVSAVSALDMSNACMAELPDSDVIVKAAAVGDYRARDRSGRKIKRGASPSMELALERNPDIAAEIGRRKRPDQILAGFAAETDDMRENALKKIKDKNLDLIAANDVSRAGSGFASDANSIDIYFARRYGRGAKSASGSKWEVASALLDEIASMLPPK